MVVDLLQGRQLLEAVEKIRAHRADQEQRAVRVLQRAGQQRVEAPAWRVVGEREQFLELIDDQQERAAVLPGIAQREGQRPLVLLQALQSAQRIALRWVGHQGLLEHLGEPGQRVPARHHRAEQRPPFEAGAAPQRPLLDHREHAGLHQRGFAGAAVAFDLQPAMVGAAVAAGEVVRVGLLLVTEAGQCFERFPAAAEEQPRITTAEGIEAEEGTALDRRLRFEAYRPGADRCQQLLGQQLAGRPARTLEQRQERRQRIRLRAVEQHRKDRQARRIVRRRQVPAQGHLHLGTDPAPDTVAADQHDEGRTIHQRLFQTAQPAIAGADRILVTKRLQPHLFERRLQRNACVAVGAAVAEKYRSRPGGVLYCAFQAIGMIHAAIRDGRARNGHCRSCLK